MATYKDVLYFEDGKPITQVQSHHNLETLFETLPWKPGSSLSLVFKCVLFYNSLPGLRGNKLQAAVVPLKNRERKLFCSPQLFKLISLMKVTEY